MKSLILALLSLISFSVKAFGPNCFPISNDLNGTWEAVSVDYPNYPLKVFRMIITDDGESSFSYTLWDGRVVTSKLIEQEVTEGSLSLKFHREVEPIKYSTPYGRYTLTGNSILKGEGQWCWSYSILNVEFILEPHIENPVTWQLTFLKPGDGSLTNKIYKMSDAIEQDNQN